MEGIRRTDGHVLRRYTRRSLAFSPLYDPIYGTPEENTFEVLKGNGGKVGLITFQKFGFNHSVADTPWGTMGIAKRWVLKPFEVTLGGTPIARYSLGMSGLGMNLHFARGETMLFKAKLLSRALVCETGAGRVEVLWEGEYGPGDIGHDGLLDRDMRRELRDRIDEARADYRRRKKAGTLNPGEPGSIQMPYYFQWRILLPNELQGRDDILSTLVFLASFRRLIGEIPPSG